MAMTSDAKSKLSKTIRALRERLLIELNEASDREYKLSIPAKEVKLNLARRTKRARLEDWLAEQVRAETGKQKRDKDDFRREAEKQAAYTLLNRLVILRIMEATGLRKPLVATGGWNSRGYKDFRELAPALVRTDDSEGYSILLQLIFEDLATDLPGLFGSAGISDLIPVPSPTIRAVVEAFDDPELETCWTDDMTLGWVYQYWNDPERESLDAKINDGGKIEPHEIASKTQMFTERYMVDWLLQNSLGPMWLAMCRKHGWTPEVESDDTLERLEKRRVEWRRKRDKRQAAVTAEKAKQEQDSSCEFDQDKLPGVSLTELMPLETDGERHWAYYVPQPIPDDAVEHAPDSVRDLKILDPAVGSGHFLVVAFDLLFALYKEEARHRGEVNDQHWSDVAIVEHILEHNLHGIDLDPRAVQIAAAALWLKAQQTCREAHPRQLNLVASNLGIASLPDNDPALVELRRAVEEETGIPAELTNQIVEALNGADHLGSLLKVDAAIDAAITKHEKALHWDDNVQQLNLFPDGRVEQQKFPFPREQVQFNVLAALELFMSRHSSGQELGLRLRGEQLAAGVRFVRLVRENAYDLVVANPPYQGTPKMTDAEYVEGHYIAGKADLFAAFLLRGLELSRTGGLSALLTMRNWMFIDQYSDLRELLLQNFDLRAIGDFAIGAFDEVANDLLSVAVSVFRHAAPSSDHAIAIQPMPIEEQAYDRQRTRRKRAGTICHRERYEFNVTKLRKIESSPLPYWWSDEFLQAYLARPKLGDVCEVKNGVCTGNDVRFTRFAWEVDYYRNAPRHHRWQFLVMGGEGKAWFEPVRNVIRWELDGFELGVFKYVSKSVRLRDPKFRFRQGVAYTTVGASFLARVHRIPGIFGHMGASVFPDNVRETVCFLNSTVSRFILSSLNPTLHFEKGDVDRVAVFPVEAATEVFNTIDAAYSIHEAHQETSIEYSSPGPSPWEGAQCWAFQAVDGLKGEPLPPYNPVDDPEPATDHVSHSVGVALGRFGAEGEGVLDPSRVDLSGALPHGILFLDGTLAESDLRDSLGHPAAQIIHDKWDVFRPDISSGNKHLPVRDWLREKFFGDIHRQMYENRPIHWPLSSAKRTFVAWITIHRWNDKTLRVLLADHLQPTLTRLAGELDDLTAVRGGADKKAARDAEQRYDDVKAWRDELIELMAVVQQCADKGPAPLDPKKPEREVDTRYTPALDDGVMVNSAAMWPLLEPQWKDPKKWWKELVAAKGRKDYDWSQLAMRYWPTRVDKKCQTDPSLGVAHGCFWKYHPARGWAWELRQQDEIGPGFRIEEAPYRGDGGDAEHRAAYLKDHAIEALEAVEKEVLRRRKKKERPQSELALLESGLWSSIPGECWDLEMRLIKKQKTEFRLLSPDEPEARAKFEEANPEKARTREQLLDNLQPKQMFAASDETEATV